jgi:hypothetical protein
MGCDKKPNKEKEFYAGRGLQPRGKRLKRDPRGAGEQVANLRGDIE